MKFHLVIPALTLLLLGGGPSGCNGTTPAENAPEQNQRAPEREPEKQATNNEAQRESPLGGDEMTTEETRIELENFAKDIAEQLSAMDLEALKSHVAEGNALSGCPGVAEEQTQPLEAMPDAGLAAVSRYSVTVQEVPDGCPAGAGGRFVLAGKDPERDGGVMVVEGTAWWHEHTWLFSSGKLVVRSADCTAEPELCKAVLDPGNEIHAY